MVGEWNLKKIDGSEHNYKVEKIIVHPKWNPDESDWYTWYKTAANDIALVKLAQSVKMRGKYTVEFW